MCLYRIDSGKMHAQASCCIPREPLTHNFKALQVEALKALSIKLINTATFVYQLYRIQINSTGDTTVSINNTSNLQARA